MLLFVGSHQLFVRGILRHVGGLQHVPPALDLPVDVRVDSTDGRGPGLLIENDQEERTRGADVIEAADADDDRDIPVSSLTFIEPVSTLIPRRASIIAVRRPLA